MPEIKRPDIEASLARSAPFTTEAKLANYALHLEGRIAGLVAALEFYADEANWELDQEGRLLAFVGDCIGTAQALDALKAYKGEKS